VVPRMANKPRTTLHRIKRAAKHRGISQIQIAEAAEVTRQHVCHVFAGRVKSRPVIATAKRLIAEHDAARTQQAETLTA
jgi:transcriptional regulator with XRE-family HTH domain